MDGIAAALTCDKFGLLERVRLAELLFCGPW